MKEKPEGAGKPKTRGKLTRSDAEWRALLTPLQYNLTRKNGMQRPFSSDNQNPEKSGAYRCVCCRATLFRPEDKLDSDSGWVEFGEPAAPDCLRRVKDYAWLIPGTAVRCARCEAHLGRFLPGAPAPARQAYRINPAALKFTPSKPV